MNERIRNLLEELDERCSKSTVDYSLPSEKDDPLFYELCN